MKPYPIEETDSLEGLLMGSVKAGFPSPAEDVSVSTEDKLDYEIVDSLFLLIRVL